MKASLDTNVIIHLYRAGLQNILFEFFLDGTFIYEQIEKIELVNHGKDILPAVEADIAAGRIALYTDAKLKEQGVYRIFENHVKENRNLYNAGDMGEVYAISLAQTIGAYSLVTDDTKQGGPYMSLLHLPYEVMPFNFADVLILRYLLGTVDAQQTVEDFNAVNMASNLNWSFRSQIVKFGKRFWKDPYKAEDKQWLEKLAADHGINIVAKIKTLGRVVQKNYQR